MATITCQPELDIAAAGVLHQQLLRAMQDREPVEIDAEAVSRVHAAVLQLFLSLTREARSLNLPVRWLNPSPTLVKSARLLGLADVLGLGLN